MSNPRKHTWTAAERHFLHVARSEFRFDKAMHDVAELFRHTFPNTLPALNLKKLAKRLQDEYTQGIRQSSDGKLRRSEMWEREILGPNYTAAQHEERRQARESIATAMRACGIRMPAASASHLPPYLSLTTGLASETHSTSRPTAPQPFKKVTGLQALCLSRREKNRTRDQPLSPETGSNEGKTFVAEKPATDQRVVEEVERAERQLVGIAGKRETETKEHGENSEARSRDRTEVVIEGEYFTFGEVNDYDDDELVWSDEEDGDAEPPRKRLRSEVMQEGELQTQEAEKISQP